MVAFVDAVGKKLGGIDWFWGSSVRPSELVHGSRPDTIGMHLAATEETVNSESHTGNLANAPA